MGGFEREARSVAVSVEGTGLEGAGLEGDGLGGVDLEAADGAMCGDPIMCGCLRCDSGFTVDPTEVCIEGMVLATGDDSAPLAAVKDADLGSSRATPGRGDPTD